ncbi:MAG: alkaline phosphatase PafA [Bacteroidota bacterium]
MRKLKLFLSIVAILSTATSLAQEKKPKLFVGIIVDQMRVDYLYRFENKFSENGFKRLLKDGFFSKNTHYNYVPTYTGPGHASVYSGTTPEIHGIIANDWYNRTLDRKINCVDDSTVTLVGGDEIAKKSYSPINLLSSNFADELKIASQGNAKVVGVSIKNRGAILPSGHFPDGAYWYDGKTGNFVTSTYYMEQIPDWADQFNKKKLAKKYLTGKWETLLPIDEYTESGPDNNPYEAVIGLKDKPVFPYDLTTIRKKDGDYGFLPSTPFGNSIVAEMAKAAVAGEQLGKDEIADLLAISFSSTDYIGHVFGPDSKEIEDCYIRLDREIANLLTYLDKNVGKDEYVLFLTADHAVAEVPQFLIDKKIPAGYVQTKPITSILKRKMVELYGEGDWILSVSNDQIFINKPLIRSKNIDRDRFMADMIEILLEFQGIKNVFTAHDMNTQSYEHGIRRKLQNGYNAKRSGDLLMVYEPGWFVTNYGKTGTTHGSGYNYDTHVPLIMYGTGIPKGYVSVAPTEITDIIPTLCTKYNVNLPNGATGKLIKEIFN